MSKRLFAYSPAEAEEAESICRLLDEHGIAYYETPASTWGFSKAAIWLKHDDDYEKAQALLKAHEETYARQARQRYQEQTGYNPDASAGEQMRFLLKFWYEKRRMLPWIILGFILLYLYFKTFFNLFE